MKPTSPPLRFRRAVRSRLCLPIGLLASSALGLPPHAFAADPTTTDSSHSDVVVLSPFEVNAEDTSGYMARSSLAGSRLNTSLNDIPSPISVMTPELLKDIAATTPQDAMLYSLNVENLSEYSDATDPNFTRGINFNNFNGRIRGIADASATHDFFNTVLQGDTYNIDTITISSGPNAVIYGLGGTGGVINTAFKQALLRQNFLTLGVRGDSEGSLRETVDLNQSLLKNKLAIRILGLHDHFNTYRDFSSGKQRRKFITATAQPFTSTRIRGYYEDVDIRTLLPRNVMAYDGGVTAYENYVANGGSPIIDNSLRQIPAGLGNLFQVATNNRNVYSIGPSGVSLIGPLSGPGLYSLQTIPSSQFAPLPSDRYLWSLPRSSPLANRELNIFGNGTGRRMYGHIAGAILNQQIGRNLSVELGYNYESSWTDFWNMVSPMGGAIRVDPNKYLPDGKTLNPHAGQMYIEDLGLMTHDYNKMYEFRATADYHLDLTGKSKWLGSHDLVGLWTRQRQDRYWSWIRPKIIPASQAGSYQYDVRAAVTNGQTQQRFYIDPLHGQVEDLPFDPLSGGVMSDGSYFYGLYNSPATGQTWSSLTKHTAMMDALQSRWFNNHLITTIGYREMTYHSGYAMDGNNLQKPGNGVAFGYPLIENLNHSLDYWSPGQRSRAKSYGAVWHINHQWSVFYNWSDVFETPTPSHYPDNKPIPAASGNGYDYGVMWQGLGGKVNVRLDMYESVSANNVDLTWDNGIEFPTLAIEKQIGAPGRTSDNPNAYAQLIAAGQITASSPTPTFNAGGFSLESPTAYWQMTAANKSHGLEIEGTANLNSNISLLATAALDKGTNTNLGAGWLPYIASRYAYWKTWAQWEQTAYMNGSTTPLSASPGSVTSQFSQMLPNYITLSHIEGLRVAQNANWRINFVGKYTFHDGLLKGLSFGPSVRFRQAPVVGYLTTDAKNPFADWPGLSSTYVASDINSPVHGGTQLNIDGFASYSGNLTKKIKYRVALNVRNVFNHIDLVKQRVDGYGHTTIYTFTPPRVFILSADFTY